MTALPTLDAEIADLGLAIGLLSPNGGGVELDSSWFDDPGTKLAGALASDARRNALVRFADAVLGDGGMPAPEAGVALLRLFNLRELADDNTLPDLTVQVSLDSAPTNYVEVGLAVSLHTVDPAATVDLRVPLYRAAKANKPAQAQPFALLAGGQIRLGAELTLQPGPVPQDEFGLAGVAVSVQTALSGGPPPAFSLRLLGLHLPGATEATDFQIGGPGASIEDSLLSLVLGVVKQRAASLSGPSAAQVGAVLDLLGLGDTAGIPPLPVADVLADGIDAVRDWILDLVGTPAARTAWLQSLRDLLGGSLAGDRLVFPIGGGGVNASIGWRTATGPGGHLQVTPQLGLSFQANVTPGAVRLGAAVAADLLTIDVATASITAAPHAEVLVTATGSGSGDAAKLLNTGNVDIGALRLGMSIDGGHPRALVELHDVDIEGHHRDVLDLTNPDAVIEAAGQLASDLIGAALDALGAAAAEFKALLGLTPPAGVPPLDAGQLLADPLGALRAWWHGLLTAHAAEVPAVLAHLRNLIAGSVQFPQPVTGTGSDLDPWSIPVAPRLSLDCWLDGNRLVIAPNLSLRVDDLAGGCTMVATAVRAELVTIDLVGGHAQFLTRVELTAKARARGGTEARLSLGRVAIVADFIGVTAGWSASNGLEVAMLAPSLAADLGTEQVPLVLPTIDADGHLTVPPAAWASVEMLIGVLAANSPRSWLADLVELTGWGLRARPGPHLSLADLVVDPVATLTDWLTALIISDERIGTLTAELSHLIGGTKEGLAGVFAGSGTPQDPWLACLGSTLQAPAIAVWLGPHGPVASASQTTDAIQGWRPGQPGLGAEGLAQSLFDEASAGEDVALLAAGRDGIAAGLAALAGRWAGTDGLAGPPPADIPGLTTVIRPNLDASMLADVPIEPLLPAGLPPNAVLVRVAIGPVAGLPWTPAVGRLIDLTPPGLAPASFAVADPAPGEWVVALAPRADTSLGAADPTGVLGQAARLQQVVTELASAGPVVLVALGGSGHAARVVADAVAGVTHLVTLGTPWSPATFDTARTGVPADALRLMRALLPDLDPAEPDDPDLARGRTLVSGFMSAARGAAAITELEAPRPALDVRAGLTAIAVFGVLGGDIVDRAMTAVFAAGLAGRAQARYAVASAPPTSAHLGIRIAIPSPTPPGGHGTTVSGSAMLTLGSITWTAPGAPPQLMVALTPSVRVDLAIADSDAWLVGGPGTAPVGGALPLELRRLRARIDFGLRGGPSTAEIVLGEGAALGAEWVSLRVQPPSQLTGQLELEPLLPEAQAALAALCGKLAIAPAAAPAGLLLALFRAIGFSRLDDGALIPDALGHLLHDPGGRLRALLAVPGTRANLLAALSGLIPALSVTGDQLHLAIGPLTADADVGAGTVTLSAAGTDGLVPWHLSAGLNATGPLAFSFGLGDPATDAFALTAQSGPLQVQLVRDGAPSVQLWPTPDVDGLGQLAVAAIPAEAFRLVLEGLRRIDNQLGTALDDIASALGMLGPPDLQGHRAVRAPVRLFHDPAGWFAQAGVLALVNDGPLDTEKVIDLLEGIKPFVGLAGTPRGTWPVTDGVTVAVAPAAAGPRVSLSVDATSWLAGAVGRAPVAAGLDVGITIAASGPPRPSVELFVGVPDGPGGISTPDHRRAAHLLMDAAGLQILLRPGAGPDVELYPNPAGLGSLLAAGVTAILPYALTQLAAMSGDQTRDEIAALVGATGRGLAVVVEPVASPPVFDGAKLAALAADPPGWLHAHRTTLLDQVADALDPVLKRLLALPPANQAAVLSPSGVLTVTVRTVVVAVHLSPFKVEVSGSTTGLPVIQRATLSLSANAAGLSGWSATVGPAELSLDGAVVRPFLRAGSAQPTGWYAQLGLALDAMPPTQNDHRELMARWRQSDGLTVLATNRTGPSTVVEDATPPGVATAAIGAVVDLVGGWVLGIAEVKNQLATPVGTKTVRYILETTILDPAAPPTAPKLLGGALNGWPGKLLTIASRLAEAAPSVPVGPFAIGIANTGGVLGVRLTTPNAAGIDLTSGGELSLRLEVDASWIEPPSGPSPAPGIVLNLLKLSGADIVAAPGIMANGVGLRLGKVSGPLIDAGLKLQSVAVHTFGSVTLDASQHKKLAGGIQVELGGLAVPLGGGGGDNAVAKGIMSDAGGSGAPPRPAFSPAIAVQDHGAGAAVTLRAGSGDGPWFLPIQRAFGPVYLEQVGLGVAYRQGITPRELEMISLYLDGGVSLLGLSASVDKLRFGYHQSRPFFAPSSWEIDVEGFAIAASVSGLSLAGGLRKFPLDAPLSGVEYLGMLKVGFGVYRIDLFGGYAHPTTPGSAGYASFFAFGVLHAPIGGPPAFFITGIGVGFGINRELHTPGIEDVDNHPFMLALRASGPAPDPMVQLRDMRALVAPAEGQFWVAAGVSFTSFVLITGEILVTVQFGDGLEIAILGMARAQLPRPELTLVSIELALLARFSSKEGLLLVQAQLTENSWLLDRSVRLTGGFAFATWWKGPNAGQFVVTVGGYHPRFHHEGYPVVPRVGLRWAPIENISVVGGVYFALCSEALMAGAGIEIAAHFGPAYARLAFGGDGIVFFDPFWFSVSAYAEIYVGIEIWLLFGTVTLEFSFGVAIEVSGPPIFVTGHFSVYGIEIPFEFGDRGDPTDRALTAGDFATKYLRGEKDAQVTQATVIRGSLVAGKAGGAGGGQAKPPDGSAEHPFRVVPEFQLTLVTTVPTESLSLAGPGGPKQITKSTPGLGVAPMYSATLDTAFTLTLANADQPPQTFSVDKVVLSARPAAAFPKGVWGPAQNPKAPTIPAGETIDACDGMTIDTVLPDSQFMGRPPIDYHQVELPLGGRKPLPFVTNRTLTDARVAQAVVLKNAATVLTQGSPDTAERFHRAAVMLAAGGSGRTTVASLRGDRTAAPSFGSLADDLVDSPDPVSPDVDPVVVDRTKPPGRRYAPIVKSVLGVPLTLTLDRPGRTTVAEPGHAIRRVAPSLASVRASHAGSTQATLVLVARPARGSDQRRVRGVGVAPLTRLGSGSVAAVANARPAPPAAERLAVLSDQLLAEEGAGTLVHDGELVVVTIANRPTGDALDTLVVSGAATRVLCLAAGGRALDDRVVDPAESGGKPVAVELPRATERVAVVGMGSRKTVGGTVAGWYAGQSLPSVGWGAALAGGAVVTAQATRIPDNRERADGGWVNTSQLATAAQVVTVFTDPVDVIAVVIDDYVGGDAAAKVSMRLLDADRKLGSDGAPLPPKVLVDGVRTTLLYAVQTTGPEPGVLVDGCGSGHLAGVLGAASGVGALAATLATAGVDASVQQPLVGGPDTRRVTVSLGDGPVAKYVPRRVAKRKKANR